MQWLLTLLLTLILPVYGESRIVCANCHPNETARYFKSPMGQSREALAAVKLGAKPQGPVSDMFWGDRCGRLVDPEGYTWYVATHIAEPTPAQKKKQMVEDMKKWRAQQQSLSSAAASVS